MTFFLSASRTNIPTRGRPALVGLAWLAVVFLLGACQDQPLPKGPVVTDWAVVEPGDVQRVIEAGGVVKTGPEAEVRVGSRIGGQIRRLTVKTGDVVGKGQLLAEIDDRELRTMRDQDQAKLDSAKAEMARVSAGQADRLEGKRAKLAGSVGVSDYARNNAIRRGILHGLGDIPGDQLESAQRDAKTSAQSVAADSAALQREDKEVKADLKAAREGVAAAKALVDLDDARLSMTHIESPIDGIVGKVVSQEGEEVAAELEAVHILTVIDPRFLELWVYVNEASLAGVRPGMPVRFIKPSQKENVMASVVTRVLPSPETINGVRYYPVIAGLSLEAAKYLRPQMDLQCWILVDQLKGVLSVPSQAVFPKAGKRVVYVDDGPAGVKAVFPRFGLVGNNRVQVLDGLEPGQRVAVKLARGGQ